MPDSSNGVRNRASIALQGKGGSLFKTGVLVVEGDQAALPPPPAHSPCNEEGCSPQNCHASKRPYHDASDIAACTYIGFRV